MTAYDCNDIKAILSGLVDDEVDAATRHAAERHLSDCAACRRLLSEAESLNDLVAADALALSTPSLPAGFSDAVLKRTVYARAYEQAGWNMTTWLGWVAAAAALGLAASIWFLDQAAPQRFAFPSLPPQAIDVEPSTSAMAAASRDASGLRSWTFDDGLSLEDLNRVQRTSHVTNAPREPADAAPERIAAHAALSSDDRDALRSTAAIMDMLAHSDVGSFVDMQLMREIALYDELPQRLADVRTRLQPVDRTTLLAAESMIMRVVNGPIDLEDLRVLRDTAESIDLAGRVGDIAGSAAPTSL